MKTTTTVNSSQSASKAFQSLLGRSTFIPDVLTAPHLIGLDNNKEQLKQSKEDTSVKRHTYQAWRLLQVQRQLKGLKSKATCGLPSTGSCCPVSVNSFKNGYSHFGGLNYCKSSLCVVCGGKLASQRAETIEFVLSQLDKFDLQAFFITFTVESIKDCDRQVKILNQSFNTALTGLRTWFKREFGSESLKNDFMTFRHNDYTFKIDGFHNHLHTLFILPKSVKRGHFNNRLIDSFVSKVRKLGLNASGSAQDIRKVKSSHVGSYLTKMFNLGAELTSTQTKTVSKSKKSLTYPQLLKRALDDGCKGEWFNIYQRFMTAMKGKRLYSASNNVKDFIYRALVAQNDVSEPLEEEVEEEVEVVSLPISTPLYRLIEAHKAQATVLMAVETVWEEDNSLFLMLETLSEEARNLYLRMDFNYNEQMLILSPSFKAFLDRCNRDTRLKIAS